MGTVEDCLSRAEEEEKNYNWVEVIELYEEAVEELLAGGTEQGVAITLEKLAYAYYWAAGKADKIEEVKRRYNLAIEAFDRGAELFKKEKIKSKSLTCRAESYFIHGLLAESVKGSKELLQVSYGLFDDAAAIYSAEEDYKSQTEVLVRSAQALFELLSYEDDHEEILRFGKSLKVAAEDAWDISERIGERECMAESMSSLLFYAIHAIYCLPIDACIDTLNSIIRKGLKLLGLLEGSDHHRSLFLVYYALGWCTFVYGAIVSGLERKQREYITKTVKLGEKPIEHAKLTGDNAFISLALTHFMPVIIGYHFIEDMSGLFEDVEKAVEHTKLTLNTWLKGLVYMYAGITYSNFAWHRLIPPSQRKKYAERAIELEEEALKILHPARSQALHYL
jgi:hypothetical protein